MGPVLALGTVLIIFIIIAVMFWGIWHAFISAGCFMRRLLKAREDER